MYVFDWDDCQIIIKRVNFACFRKQKFPFMNFFIHRSSSKRKLFDCSQLREPCFHSFRGEENVTSNSDLVCCYTIIITNILKEVFFSFLKTLYGCQLQANRAWNWLMDSRNTLLAVFGSPSWIVGWFITSTNWSQRKVLR